MNTAATNKSIVNISVNISLKNEPSILSGWNGKKKKWKYSQAILINLSTLIFVPYLATAPTNVIDK